MIAHNFQKISHFWKSIWLSKPFLMPLVYGFKIINIDSHILFPPLFLLLLSILYTTPMTLIHFFFLRMMLKVNTSAEKAWSKNLFHLAMLFIHVSLQSSCHSREQPIFLWAIYQKWHHQKVFWWPGRKEGRKEDPLCGLAAWIQKNPSAKKVVGKAKQPGAKIILETWKTLCPWAILATWQPQHP